MGFSAPDSPTKTTEMSESDELEVLPGAVGVGRVGVLFSGSGEVVSLVGVSLVLSGVGGVGLMFSFSGSGDVSLRRLGVLEMGELSRLN